MSIKGPKSSPRTQPCPSAAIVASSYPPPLCQRCRWYQWPHRFSLWERKHVTFALGSIRNASTDMYHYAERGLGVEFVEMQVALFASGMAVAATVAASTSATSDCCIYDAGDIAAFLEVLLEISK